MFRSYWHVAIRGFLRNKVASFINIGGLMLGLTTGIVISLFVVFAFGFDRFHTNYKQIHLVEMNQAFSGTLYTGNATSCLLGPALKAAMPALKYVVRAREEGESLTRVAEKALYQKSLYVDPDFFHMMTFPAIEGDPTSTLREARGVILTQSAARRLFGDAQAMGKTILLNNTYPVKVGCVVRDLPFSSSIQFDLALPFNLFERDNTWMDSWDSRSVQTWLQLEPNANVAALNRQMTEILLKNRDGKKASLFAYPIERLHLYDNFKDGKPYWGKAYLILAIALLAFLTLVIACINFMNLSTAMAERRAKEVGVRKVLGASRKVIVMQFLGEAILMTMMALVLATGLAYVALPWFAAFAELPLSDGFGHPQVWICLVVLGLFTGLLAGSYPAFYLSRFQPVKVLKRLMSTGRKGGLLRKSLVTIQFVISTFLVIITVVVVRQVHYVAARPLGFESSNLVDIIADGDLPGQFETFKDEVGRIPGVVNLTAGTSNMVNIGIAQSGLDWPGKRPDQDFVFQAIWVRYDWTKTAGLKVVEGRDFSPSFGADSSSCLINETAIRKMGLKGPVLGAMVNGRKVVGVLQDFVVNFSGRGTQPIIVYLGKENLNHFLVRLTNDGQWKTHLAQIGKVVRTLHPGYPFTFHFTDEEHQQYFKNDYGVEQLANIFSVLAVLISGDGIVRSGQLSDRKADERNEYP